MTPSVYGLLDALPTVRSYAWLIVDGSTTGYAAVKIDAAPSARKAANPMNARPSRRARA